MVQRRGVYAVSVGIGRVRFKGKGGVRKSTEGKGKKNRVVAP